jgi:hypothetical protein
MSNRPSWTNPGSWEPLPDGPSAFELEVRRLKLRPQEYADSAELKDWVRQHKDQRYVPLDLLRDLEHESTRRGLADLSPSLLP